MMKGGRRGSTLIEFTLYLLVAVLVTSICSRALHTGYRFFIEGTRRSTRLMEIYTALDVFARDIRAASNVKDDWKLTNDVDLVWRGPNGDIGWSCKKGSLWRVAGVFDGEQRVWRKRSKSLVAQASDECCFTVHESPDRETVRAATIMLTVNGKSVAATTTLCNGEVV